MVSFRPTSPETYADRELYTSAWLTEVACQDCLARVGVQKNSERHTSIQWTDEAEAQCPELSRRERPRGHHPACPRLLASIDQAIRDGVLEVGVGAAGVSDAR